MKKVGLKILLLFIAVIIYSNGFAQPFAREFKEFKTQDSTSFPPKNAILLIGSSSFTIWQDVQSYFPDKTIINRGFGGSTLKDIIFYAEKVIFPYQPKQIVIYCGENDIAESDTVTRKMVLERFKNLFSLIRTRIPGVPILFVSLKPSPARWEMKERMIASNKLIKKYLRKQKKTKFLSVWKPMLGADGTPIKEIFTKDNLHMNAKGYAIWQKLMAPLLIN
jgi:lysophospholipase L1-like esterase